MNTVVVRPLKPEDDLALLTDLIHSAYAPRTAQGLRYWASIDRCFALPVFVFVVEIGAESAVKVRCYRGDRTGLQRRGNGLSCFGSQGRGS